MLAPNQPDSQDVIYTTKGLIPVAQLYRADRWTDDAATESTIHGVEFYTLDGELVRSDAHVYARRAFVAGAIAGSTGG